MMQSFVTELLSDIWIIHNAKYMHYIQMCLAGDAVDWIALSKEFVSCES